MIDLFASLTCDGDDDDDDDDDNDDDDDDGLDLSRFEKRIFVAR